MALAVSNSRLSSRAEKQRRQRNNSGDGVDVESHKRAPRDAMAGAQLSPEVDEVFDSDGTVVGSEM